ncbi:Actin- protein 4 [Naganishia cerealis]|jgi:actin-related protein 4|uniref:Actin- protein 4 n=1 Tax=Naganishia cerealis TaxID=610337 RepID=A0ACC2V900_9TREE|nr:Actin- protein 4 [Naganishia cerealis]
MSGSAVHGGDEINAIVLDPGSYYTRIGYAGDDFPKITTPSFFAIGPDPPKKGKRTRIFGEAIGVPRSNYEVKPIIKDSLIVDWDAAIEQYKYYFEDVLKINYKEQPILIVEPVWATTEYRQKVVEEFFANFDFPALYLAKSPTCISFQQGRANCLVVDIGHDSVSITPVIDGMSLLRNTTKTHYAGAFLNAQIQDMLNKKYPNLDLCAKYLVRDRTPTKYPEEAKYTQRQLPDNITDSFYEYQQLALWHEIKETMLEVPEKKLASDRETYKDETHKRSFELPLGQLIELGIERFELADSLFDPKSYPLRDQDKFPPTNGEVSIKTMYDDYRPVKRTKRTESSQSSPPPEEEEAVTIRGLSQLVAHTLTSVDIDLRASMAHNIIISGGTSLITQLTERIQADLSNTNPGLKVRLHAVGSSAERSSQSWIGGSVLSSLGTFHQMWVTKEEYQQAGAEKILNQRFR